MQSSFFFTINPRKYRYDTKGEDVDLRTRKYPLADVKRLVENDKFNLTLTATKTSDSLGYGKYEVADVLLTLTPENFVKATTENYNHKVWQDVYKISVNGLFIYIKFKITKINGEDLLILSFKKDDSRE